MNQKNKAFTLIELLAVIIILAAIALIVAPLVLDIIKEQKMKTFKESINGVLRSSRLELVNSGLSFPATFTYRDGKLVSPSGKELKVTGKIPGGSGTVTYYQEDNIELFIHDDDWCGSYNKINKEVEVNEYTGTCGIVFTPETCFEFDENTGTITDYFRDDTDCPADVVIPDTIGGVPVEVIGDSSFMDKLLTSVVLPIELLRIEDRAFTNSIVIGYHQESYQGQLLRATNKEYKVQRLQSVTGDNQITNVDFSRVTKLYFIGDSAFWRNQLTSVEIPNSVTSIGWDAFRENQLTSVTIPNSVTTIGLYAFMENQLTSVVIPSSVTSIGSGAFNDNQLPDDQAFIYARNSDGSIDYTKLISYGGAKRDNVVIPSNVTSIGDDAFFGNQLTSVTIPDSVTSIGIQAFSHNELTSVTIQGKSSSSEFTSYPSSTPFDWASGYSDSNIIWNG